MEPTTHLTKHFMFTSTKNEKASYVVRQFPDELKHTLASNETVRTRFIIEES